MRRTELHDARISDCWRWVYQVADSNNERARPACVGAVLTRVDDKTLIARRRKRFAANRWYRSH